VSNELATVANKKRNRKPECLVREHVRNRLNTPDLPVNDHANDDVCDDTDKKKYKNNDSKDLTTISGNELTATSLALDDSSDGATISGDGDAGDSFLSATDDMNLGRSARAGWAVLTLVVQNGHTLTSINTVEFDRNKVLCLKKTEAHSGPEARATADRGGRRAGGGGITTEVEVSEITSVTHIIKAIRELSVVVKRGQIVPEVFATFLDNTTAVERNSCDVSHKQSNKDKNSLHSTRQANTNPNKPMYFHVTCATDTKKIEVVLDIVKDVIFRNILHGLNSTSGV